MKKLCLSLLLIPGLGVLAKPVQDTLYERYKWDSNTFVYAEIRSERDTAKFVVRLDNYSTNEGYGKKMESMEQSFDKQTVKAVLALIESFLNPKFSGMKRTDFGEESYIEMSRNSTEEYMLFVAKASVRDSHFRLSVAEIIQAQRLLKHIYSKL